MTETMQLRGTTVVVLGLGSSGIAAARLCLSRGARVIGLDSRGADQLPAHVSELGIELQLGQHDAQLLASADTVVVSPGVPPLSVLDAAAQAGAEVIGELELAARFIDAPVVCVGGTNGKSTTTTLLASMLEASGARVFAGGNLGQPACDAVGQDCDIVVFEVSSFQLERAPRLAPRVSVLLNITEDHLDRYEGFADYANAKGNAFVNQTSRDVAIVPRGDAICHQQAARGRGRLVEFGSGGDYEIDGERLLERASGEVLDLSDCPLHGAHNRANLAAATAAARALGVDFAALALGLERFVPLSHRMQRVAVIDGVSYYDDSKGTNVGASVTAVLGLSEPRCVLIAGGRDKHGSYEPLVEALKEKGRAVVVIGEAKERIRAAIGSALPVVVAGTMQQAVLEARRLAQPGDAVLLSPACSSFDMFSGYAERGRVFASAVTQMA